MKTLTLPSAVIQRITDQINKDYPTLNEKQRIKLFNTACEMWWTISMKHINEMEIQESNYGDAAIYNLWVNIHKTDLEKFRITFDSKRILYTQILNLLTDAQTIDVNEKYSSGKFSKSYRPNTEVSYRTLTNIDLDLKFINRSFKTQGELIQKNLEWTKLITDLYLVKIDLTGYFNHLDGNLGKFYKNRQLKKQVKLKNGQTKFIEINQSEPIYFTDRLIYTLKQRAIKINLGIHSFSVADTGRIYSSIANLHKSALPFITLNDNEVIERDAVNCQPLLLASLIDNEQYRNDCETGCFYERFSEGLDLDRNQVKLWCYSKIFFNDAKIIGSSALQLDSVYPGLSAQINEFKEQPIRENQLWFRLQSLEAAIFVKVASQVHFPVITRHDSIIVNAKWQEEVDELIVKEFKRIGLMVNLK